MRDQTPPLPWIWHARTYVWCGGKEEGQKPRKASSEACMPPTAKAKSVAYVIHEKGQRKAKERGGKRRGRGRRREKETNKNHIYYIYCICIY